MDCTRYQEQINQFIDGELEMRPQVELFQHLAVCSGCQSLIDAMMRMKEAVRNEHIPFPSGLDDAILGQILSRTATPLSVHREEKHSERVWNKQVSIPVHLAASFAIIIIAAGLLLGRMFLPPAEIGQQSTALHAGTGQPQTVILIYGMPPVEVFGTPTVKTLKGIDQHNN
jgi:hypothetical protein